MLVRVGHVGLGGSDDDDDDDDGGTLGDDADADDTVAHCEVMVVRTSASIVMPARPTPKTTGHEASSCSYGFDTLSPKP